jgi:hypothetical protein
MGLSWGRQELLNRILIDLKRRVEDFGLCFQYISAEVEGSKEPFQNGRKYTI